MKCELQSYAKPQGMDDWGEDAIERWKRNTDNVMVTVVCISYRHEDFIAQALDSFLAQKTTFKFKVFVGEDCGGDGTADIIREYAEKYPDVIVPFIRETNMGAQRNLIDLCRRADSPYIAFCEGDDYWVDEYKLQKQYDYMEEHPEYRVCTARTEIDAPEDWHLRSWYKPTEDGRLIIPDSIPGFKNKSEYTPGDIIGINVAHTSTHFYRWDDSVVIPDWYYEGIIGDTPLLLLQLGNSNLAVLPDVVSVYRINEGSIFFDKDRESNFLRTRLDYVSYLCGLLDYAEDRFDDYPFVSLENRIKVETGNYLRLVVKQNDVDKIEEFFSSYPRAGRMFLEAAVANYFDQRSLTASLGWSEYKTLARDKTFRKDLKPCLQKYRKKQSRIRLLRRKKRTAKSIIRYWRNTFKPKDNSVWVFSGFKKKSYLDNTKYLYEYVVKNHPEIQAYWVTNDDSLVSELNSQSMPVVKMNSKEGRELIAHAGVGFTDHFRMSDFNAMDGLNDRLKIVQLWHGVGLKAIGDLGNTDVPGVRFSDDILASPTDGFVRKIIKHIRYFIYAPHRELFEHYYALVCPGEERILQIADPWHIPHDACLIAGHPRNELLHTTNPSKHPCKIIYAPTYRWNVRCEKRMIKMLTDAAPAIQGHMEKIDGALTVRLHPHTWRDYKYALKQLADKYDRILLDEEKDVYSNLGEYSILISDYSSIAYDFVLVDRPVVFFAFDLDDFTEQECKLNYDYESYSPGFHTSTWQETLDAIETYINDPSVHSEWRSDVRSEFYDMRCNDENNSERIVSALKSRLGLR